MIKKVVCAFKDDNIDDPEEQKNLEELTYWFLPPGSFYFPESLIGTKYEKKFFAKSNKF